MIRLGSEVESCSRIKDGNGRLAQGGVKHEGFGRSILKIYIYDTQEHVAVHMCGFDGIWRGNYFRGESTGRVKVRVGKLKNGKASGKDL